VAVAVWATAGGDVCVRVEERLMDGSVGEHAEARVARAALCTMAERRQLEVAERRRAEALVEGELRLRAGREVLALPAPEGDAEVGQAVAPVVDGVEEGVGDGVSDRKGVSTL